MQILAGGQYFRGRVSFVSGGALPLTGEKGGASFSTSAPKKTEREQRRRFHAESVTELLGFFFGWLFGENDFPSWGWQGQKARQGRWAEPGISWRQANPVVFYWM